MGLESIADGVRALATLGGVLVIAYSGLILTASRDPMVRSQWKEVILGVLVGLSIVYFAPLASSALSGGSYCG